MSVTCSATVFILRVAHINSHTFPGQTFLAVSVPHLEKIVLYQKDFELVVALLASLPYFFITY